MIECNECHCYLSDWEINASKYTEKYCLVCRPEGVMNNEVEISVEIHGRNHNPNYVVCYDMSKDDLYDLVKLLYESKAFIIPIYTKEVKDVPDFSDAHLLENNEYLIKPFYVGSNNEIAIQYVARTVEMITQDDYLYWKPVRDYVDGQVREKGWKETMMIKLPNN